MADELQANTSAPAPLIEDALEFDNIMANPILKPIAEASKSINDIEQFINKRLTDMNREEKWIEEALKDNTTYSDSPFINRLMLLYKATSDVIRMQDVQNRTYKTLIRELVSISKQKYIVITDDSRRQKKETIVHKIRYDLYLKNLVEESKYPLLKSLSEEVLKKFTESVEPDEEKRYSQSCVATSSEHADKEHKKMLYKILKMEAV